MTLNTIFEAYIELKSPNLAPHVIRSYVSAYNTHIKFRFGTREISTLTYVDWQRFANALTNSGKKPKTVKNIISVMSGVYKFAIKNDWYDAKNYPAMVELPKFDNKFYINIPLEQQKRYLMAIKSFDEPIYKDIFLFLLHGRRLGEVLNLKWEFIDLPSRIVYFPASNNKSRKNLVFELTDLMVERLKEYQLNAIDEQGTIFLTGYVFKNPNTCKPFTDLRKPWKRLLDGAGLDYIKLHAVRHLVGSYAVNELRLPLIEVSYMLGHSDTKITQRYVTVKPRVAKNVTQQIFDSLNTGEENYVEKLNQAIVLGEAVQSALFSDEECNSANEVKKMHKSPNPEGKFYY